MSPFAFPIAAKSSVELRGLVGERVDAPPLDKKCDLYGKLSGGRLVGRAMRSTLEMALISGSTQPVAHFPAGPFVA